jgi:hypothetical protein
MARLYADENSSRPVVDVLPEDDGGFTLWLRELNVANTGPTLGEARRDLLAAVRSYVRDYIRQFDFYRHLTDLAAQAPYVVRLSLAQGDGELIDILFGASAAGDASESSGSDPGVETRAPS